MWIQYPSAQQPCYSPAEENIQCTLRTFDLRPIRPVSCRHYNILSCDIRRRQSAEGAQRNRAQIALRFAQQERRRFSGRKQKLKRVLGLRRYSTFVRGAWLAASSDKERAILKGEVQMSTSPPSAQLRRLTSLYSFIRRNKIRFHPNKCFHCL